jgi:hypothetical protein
MDLKIFDFSSLFQVALGMNLAVPFFGDAMSRPLLRSRQTLESLPALQNLIPQTERGEYLGEISALRGEFVSCEDDVKSFANYLSLLLFLIAAISFAILYYGASNPHVDSKAWIIDALLGVCFIPPLGGVIALFLYSQKRCADVRIKMQKVYATYIERSVQHAHPVQQV